MFEPNSRYFDIETATYTALDGRSIAYKRRRFLPQPTDLAVLDEVRVIQGDRLDLIAARELGDSELFWRIADAHYPLNPFELTEEPGSVVRIPAADIGGGTA